MLGVVLGVGARNGNLHGLYFTDIENICREAALIALRGDLAVLAVQHKHFALAFEQVRPSLSQEQLDEYAALQAKFASA